MNYDEAMQAAQEMTEDIMRKAHAFVAPGKVVVDPARATLIAAYAATLVALMTAAEPKS